MSLKRFGFLGIFLVLNSIVYSQTTIVLQPNFDGGKDAVIDSRVPDSNYGTNSDFMGMAWTNGGDFVIQRSLIDFDLSGIPSGAQIVSAKLSLYGYNSPNNDGHSNLSGSNEAILQRITSGWEEDEVTWNLQPTTSNTNEVTLQATAFLEQNYVNINVLYLIEDMIDEPENSFGLLLKLKTEEQYRSMVFASSDNTNDSLHPKLEVTFIEDELSPIECVVFQPDSANGNDGFVSSDQPDTSFPFQSDFIATTWSYSNNLVATRGLLKFDELESIPEKAFVVSANLSLFGYNSPNFVGHSDLSGSNSAMLSMVNSYWVEDSVTWNNQPSTIDSNAIYLGYIVEPNQNFENLDVTALIEAMLSDSASNNGFMLRLITEQIFRSTLFASSNHNDANLRPKLEVCYRSIILVINDTINDSTDVFLPDTSAVDYIIYPNPAMDFINVLLSVDSDVMASYRIYDDRGRLIVENVNYELTKGQNTIPVEIIDFSKGTYVIKLTYKDEMRKAKFVKE